MAEQLALPLHVDACATCQMLDDLPGPRPRRLTWRFVFWQSGQGCGRCGLRWRARPAGIGVVMTYVERLGVWICDGCLRPEEG